MSPIFHTQVGIFRDQNSEECITLPWRNVRQLFIQPVTGSSIANGRTQSDQKISRNHSLTSNLNQKRLKREEQNVSRHDVINHIGSSPETLCRKSLTSRSKDAFLIAASYVAIDVRIIMWAGDTVCWSDKRVDVAINYNIFRHRLLLRQCLVFQWMFPEYSVPHRF